MISATNVCKRACFGLTNLDRDRFVRHAGKSAGRAGRTRFRRFDLLAEILQDLRCALQSTGASGNTAHTFDFVTQSGPIGRKVGRQLVHLRNKQAPKREYDAKCDHDNGNNGQAPREVPALQQSNDGRQDETQKDSKRDRNQDFASDVKKSRDQGDKENRRNRAAGS